MRAIWTAAGMPDEPPHDLRFSPHLVVAFTAAALTGERDLPDHAVLVGPVIGERPADPSFPWEWIDARRRTLLVSMGTNAMDLATDFYDRTVEALRPLADRVQAIVVAPPGVIADPPEHLLVRPRVPMLELLPHLSAVVSHGGLNTVCESLAHGVPLVIAPVKGDQPINASQVAALGAGVRVSFDHASPAALRAAVIAVLDEPAYRAAAGRVRASFQAAGGAGAAADALQALAGTRSKSLVPSVGSPVEM
jgi:zeaxanthin glucosyltransferase